MTLIPRDPPGRRNRKARAYAAEIVQLHAQGYSAAAIREALSDAGVDVSCTTVQREVNRKAGARPAVAVHPTIATKESMPPAPRTTSLSWPEPSRTNGVEGGDSPKSPPQSACNPCRLLRAWDGR